jgi:TIGR03009 family protein
MTPLVALISTGFALAVGQDQSNDRPAPARPKAAAPAPPPDPAAMDQILMDWETQSAKLKSLEVSIYRIDSVPAWGEEEHYLGSAAFRAPQLAQLDFRKVKLQTKPDPKDKSKQIFVPLQKNNQIVSTPYETIVCTGEEVWHYRSDVKQIIIYPLDKDQRKRAVEEGPLPFLFNMRAAEAKQRYQMVLKGENNKVFLVMIKPLLKEDKDSFSVAWVYLDRNFLLPTRIVLVSPDKKSSRDFRLSDIRANRPVDNRKFVGVDPGKPWKIERNPGAAAPADARGRGARRQPAGQAAQRPAAATVDGPR